MASLQAETQLEAALSAIHNPSTNREVRAQAQHVCDQFRAQPDCTMVSLQLYDRYTRNAGQGMITDAMRHFLLDTILKQVRTQWEVLDTTTKDNIKRASLELIRNGTKGILEEAVFVKEKVVGIVSSIAERDWPQRWPGFLDEVMTVARIGHTQVELVLKIFLVLAEDCYNSEFNDSLHSSRRTDILQEFHKVLPSVFPWFYQLLEQAFTMLRGSAGQPSQQAVQQEWHIAAATMKSVLAFLGWAPVKFLIQNNFLNVFCALLGTRDEAYGSQVNRGGDSLQVLAASCLRALASRKSQEIEKTIGTLPFFEQLLGALESAPGTLSPAEPAVPPPLPLLCPPAGPHALCWTYWPIHHSTQVAERLLDSHELASTLSQTVAFLGSTHYAALMAALKRTQPDTPPAQLHEAVASRFLDVLLRMTGHPGMAIPTAMLNVWGSVIKTRPWPRDLPSRLPALLRTIADRMIKFGPPSSADNGAYDHPAFAFTSLDLDDDDAFELAFGSLVGSASTVLRQLSKAAPEKVSELLAARVQICCGDTPPPPHSLLPPHAATVFDKPMNRAHVLLNPHHLPYSTCYSPVEMYFSATMVALLESGMAAIPQGVMDVVAGKPVQEAEELVGAQQSAQNLVAMARALVNFSTPDPLLLTRQLQAFARMQRLFCCGQQGIQLFGLVFEKLFAAVTFSTPQETAGLLPNTLGARKRACASMVDVFKYLSTVDKSQHPEVHHLLASELPALCQRVLDLIRQSTEKGKGIRPNEKVLLFEMLVVVSNTLANVERQIAFLDDVVSESLSVFTSPATAAAVASTETFYRFLGLESVPVPPHSHSLVAIDPPPVQPRQPGQVVPEALLPVEAALNLKHAAAAMLSLARSSKVRGPDGRSLYPFARHWQTVVPVMLQVTQAVHRCWYPEVRGRLLEGRPGDVGLVAIHPEELRVLLGRSEFDELYPEHSACAPQCACSPRQCSVVQTTLWMSSMRDLMYSLFAAASWQSKFNTGLFQIPNIKDSLAATVFHRLEAMEHRHVRKLVSNLCVPLAEGCPPEYRVPVLFPCLQYVVENVLERLRREWPHLRRSKGDFEAGQPVSNASAHPEWAPIAVPMPPSAASSSAQQRFREILQDVSIRHASRGVVDLLGMLLSVRTLKPEEREAPGKPETDSAVQKIPLRTVQTLNTEPSELCTSVLQHAPICEPVLVGLVACMKCPDALTVQKAVATLYQILPTLVESDHAAGFAANTLFPSALETLLLPATALGGLSEGNLVSLIKDTFMMFLFGAGPLDVAQAIAGQDNKVPKSSKSKLYPVTKISLTIEQLKPTRVDLAQQIIRTLAGLPGLSMGRVEALKDELLTITSEKGQKTAVRAMLQDSAFAIKQQGEHTNGATHVLGEIFSRTDKAATIKALPPKQPQPSSKGVNSRPPSPVSLSGLFSS